MKDFLHNLSPEGWARLVAAGLTLCLCLLLLVGAVWAWRLPPSPTLSPDPSAILPLALRIEERELSSQLLFASEKLPTDGEVGEDSGSSVEAQLATYSLATRPLFWPSRRPYVERQEVADEAPSPSRRDEFDQVKLEGIYSAGESSGVMVSIKSKRSRVRLNESLFGWMLKELNKDGVVFVRPDGRQRVLQLEHALPAKYTAASPSRTRPAPAAEPQSGQ